MSESNHAHHGPNSLVWGARPCNGQAERFKIKPDLVSYEELLCQLARNFDEIHQQLESVTSSHLPDFSYEEQFTGAYDRTDPDGPKKVYVKTVDCGPLPNNNVKNIPHNIQSIRRVKRITGTVMKDNSGGFIPLPFIETLSGSSFQYEITLGVIDSYVWTRTNFSSNVYPYSQVTIYYTKNE